MFRARQLRLEYAEALYYLTARRSARGNLRKQSGSSDFLELPYLKRMTISAQVMRELFALHRLNLYLPPVVATIRET